MLTATKDILRSVLKADSTMTPEDRHAVLSAAADALTGGGRDAPPLILRPKDAARMLSCTTRTLQNLKARGVLAPVRFPGNAKSHGYRRSDIERLAAGMGD